MESPVALFSWLLAFGKTWGFHTIIICFLMVVWNSMLLKIIIILLGDVKQHVRFISASFLRRKVN
jgi:hypothetical protein